MAAPFVNEDQWMMDREVPEWEFFTDDGIELYRLEEIPELVTKVKILTNSLRYYADGNIDYSADTAKFGALARATLEELELT